MASSGAPGLKREQVEKAVQALLKYIGTQKADSKDLLEDEEYLYLVMLMVFTTGITDLCIRTRTDSTCMTCRILL